MALSLAASVNPSISRRSPTLVPQFFGTPLRTFLDRSKYHFLVSAFSSTSPRWIAPYALWRHGGAPHSLVERLTRILTWRYCPSFSESLPTRIRKSVTTFPLACTSRALYPSVLPSRHVWPTPPGQGLLLSAAFAVVKSVLCAPSRVPAVRSRLGNDGGSPSSSIGRRGFPSRPGSPYST